MFHFGNIVSKTISVNILLRTCTKGVLNTEINRAPGLNLNIAFCLPVLQIRIIKIYMLLIWISTSSALLSLTDKGCNFLHHFPVLYKLDYYLMKKQLETLKHYYVNGVLIYIRH